MSALGSRKPLPRGGVGRGELSLVADEAEAVVAQIEKAGGKAKPYQADIADLEAVRSMVRPSRPISAAWTSGHNAAS